MIYHPKYMYVKILYSSVSSMKSFHEEYIVQQPADVVQTKSEVNMYHVICIQITHNTCICSKYTLYLRITQGKFAGKLLVNLLLKSCMRGLCFTRACLVYCFIKIWQPNIATTINQTGKKCIAPIRKITCIIS